MFFLNLLICHLQLRQQGFCHIDALDPSEDMLALARKDALYENYICEFITDKQLPIPPGESYPPLSWLLIISTMRVIPHYYGCLSLVQ